jgi:hypothetical protein
VMRGASALWRRKGQGRRIVPRMETD